MSPRRFLLLAAVLIAATSPVAGAETLVLTGGTVHTVSGATIENATVVVENGIIKAVGNNLTTPEGAVVRSIAGKQLYPGLVSANTVLGMVEVNSVAGTNDWSETGTTNPNIRAQVEFNPESELIPVARQNGITSALISPRGGTITGTPALIHLDGWTFEDMTVRAPVGLAVKWPNMTPVHAYYVTLSDEEQNKRRDEAIDNIRKSFEDARAYWKARDAEGKSGVPRHDRDVKWEAMGKALRGEIPVMFTADALSQIRAVLKFVDEQKLPRVVLVGGGDAWRIPDEIRSRHISVIADGTLEMPARRYDPYDAAYTVPAQLYKAGIPFCISDGGAAFTAMNARNLPYHAAMAAAFGLPKDEALKSVTLYPAQILGVGDKLGSIEPGKIADMMVTDGDPLEDATHVEQVYIAGRAVSMENRQTRLFTKYDHRPRGPKARKQPATAEAR